MLLLTALNQFIRGPTVMGPFPVWEHRLASGYIVTSVYALPHCQASDAQHKLSFSLRTEAEGTTLVGIVARLSGHSEH